MAKDSALTALAGSGVDDNDSVGIVDGSATSRKKLVMRDVWEASGRAGKSHGSGLFQYDGTVVTYTITQHAIVSSDAAAFAVGRQGATSPAFALDCSAGTSVTGWKISAQASGSRGKLVGTSSATNEGADIDAKGTGTLRFNATATGDVVIGSALQMPSAGKIGDPNSNALILFPATVASAVNQITVSNAITGVAPSIKATGTDGAITLEVAGKGSTGTVQVTSPLTDKRSVTAATNTATLTIANLLTKVIEGTPTGAATYTLPTAALAVAGITNAKVGDSFEFIVANKAASALTITLAAGSGGTALGTLSVAQNIVRRFTVVLTNVTASSEAYNLYGEGS